MKFWLCLIFFLCESVACLGQLTQESIITELNTQIKQRIERDYAKVASLNIRILNPDALVITSNQVVSYNASLDSISSLLGRNVLKINFYDDKSRNIGYKSILLDVMAYSFFLKTTKTIKKAEKIQSNDLESVYNEIYGQSTMFMQNISSVVGKEALVLIPKGSWLNINMIRAIPVITTGQTIKLHYSQDGIAMTLKGLSLEDGWIGKKIRVKSMPYNKQLIGEIIDSKNIQILDN